jgi:hypothetical protein
MKVAGMAEADEAGLGLDFDAAVIERYEVK